MALEMPAISEVTNKIYWVKWRHFVGITRYNIELNDKDLSCYSNKTESVSLRKCPHDHWFRQSSYLHNGSKTQLAQIWNKIMSLSPYVYRKLTELLMSKFSDFKDWKLQFQHNVNCIHAQNNWQIKWSKVGYFTVRHSRIFQIHMNGY